ncbi:hypothetical protein ACTFIZ_005938 [Dictyostelium cf. discoideum]
MPKTSNWSPAEDNYIKSELLKKPSLVADDILNNLNINFQQQRTKTALTQRIKKISSDLKSHTITVQVPSASTAQTIPTTTHPQPQLPNPNDNEEEYSDPSESESDEDSKSNSSLKRKSPLKKQKLHDLNWESINQQCSTLSCQFLTGYRREFIEFSFNGKNETLFKE